MEKYHDGDFKKINNKIYGTYYYELVDGIWQPRTAEQYDVWKYEHQVVVNVSGNLTKFGREFYRDMRETGITVAEQIADFMANPENRGTNLRVGALYGFECANCNLTD